VKFYKIQSAEPVAKFLADTILDRLFKGQKVLWLVGGGSGIKVAVAASQILKKQSNLSSLTFTLTDERFGAVGHGDSNWKQLLEAGFSLPGASLRPVLDGKNIEVTTKLFAEGLKEELDIADYSIGLFGIGTDGHTAGILPNSPAVSSKDYAAFYKTPEFERITMTFDAIKQLDEAVLYAVGEAKKPVLKKLNEAISLSEQPAQFLKTLPKLTVYNDQIGEDL
jgi:6-phosphogluconolactonase/glucosamine-6-phosphate isomerase/deaminase